MESPKPAMVGHSKSESVTTSSGMDNLLGLLRVRVKKGVNLAIRDVRSSDPYVVLKMGKQKLKTRVTRKDVNPEWNDDLTFSVSDPKLPVFLNVYDHDTFSLDDKMGDAEFDIRPFIEAVKMKLKGLPDGTIITRIQPSRSNCLSEESSIIWKDEKVVQDMCLRLRNVECGEVEIQLQWIDIPGSRGVEVNESRSLIVSSLQMSLAVDSPVHSSSSEDLAAFLDAELDTASNASADLEEVVKEEESDGRDDGDYEIDLKRVKRRKVELSKGVIDLQSSSSQGEPAEVLGGSSPKKTMCPHPGIYAGMCMKCGQRVDDETGVPFGYIHKNLRLANDEVARLRDKDLKNLLRHRKLYLVLDLDHTLLNSSRFADITAEEGYLHDQRDDLPDTLRSSLFRLEWMQMMTKLRPFVHTFLKEASNLFEMYIYTMGERPYALAMAKLLDPGDIYFNSRIIAQGDCTTRHQKGLDVVLGQESAVLILDDTEVVWGQHKDNLILMERYHFFASSCKHFGFNFKSLSELRSDESETDGQLATVLKILQRVHSLFFDEGRNDDLEDRDVRQVLKTVRKEVLKDCKIVFTRVFPTNFPAEHHHLWKMAEQLGATCSTELDASVTHVVSMDSGTDKSRWAVQEEKFLVHPRWIEASNYLWQKQPEDNFPVTQAKSN